jgi:hypothetical protein
MFLCAWMGSDYTEKRDLSYNVGPEHVWEMCFHNTAVKELLSQYQPSATLLEFLDDVWMPPRGCSFGTPSKIKTAGEIAGDKILTMFYESTKRPQAEIKDWDKGRTDLDWLLQYWAIAWNTFPGCQTMPRCAHVSEMGTPLLSPLGPEPVRPESKAQIAKKRTEAMEKLAASKRLARAAAEAKIAPPPPPPPEVPVTESKTEAPPAVAAAAVTDSPSRKRTALAMSLANDADEWQKTVRRFGMFAPWLLGVPEMW